MAEGPGGCHGHIAEGLGSLLPLQMCLFCPTCQPVPSEPSWAGLSQHQRLYARGWQNPSGAIQARGWNTKYSAVPPVRQSCKRHLSQRARQGEPVMARLLALAQCSTQCSPGIESTQIRLPYSWQVRSTGMHCMSLYTWAKTSLQHICSSTASDISKAEGLGHHPAFRSSICDSTTKLLRRQRSNPTSTLHHEFCTSQARRQSGRGKEATGTLSPPLSAPLHRQGL